METTNSTVLWSETLGYPLSGIVTQGDYLVITVENLPATTNIVSWQLKDSPNGNIIINDPSVEYSGRTVSIPITLYLNVSSYDVGNTIYFTLTVDNIVGIEASFKIDDVNLDGAEKPVLTPSSIDITAYGVTPDGVTIYTSLINSLTTTYRDVYFPSGTYLTGAITPVNNSTWRGDGKENTIIKGVGVGFAGVLYYGTQVAPLKNFHVYDMAFDADGIDFATAVQILYHNHCIFTRCKFLGGKKVWTTILGSIKTDSVTFGSETKSFRSRFIDCEWDDHGGDASSQNTTEQHLWVNSEECGFDYNYMHGSRVSVTSSYGVFGYCKNIKAKKLVVDFDVANDASANASGQAVLIQASQDIILEDPVFKVTGSTTRILDGVNIVNSKNVEVSGIVYNGYQSGGSAGNVVKQYDFNGGSFDNHALDPETYRSSKIKISYRESKNGYRSFFTANPGGVYFSGEDFEITGNINDSIYSPVEIGGSHILPTNTVIAIQITNQGTGYTSAPTVSFSGGGGSGAAATAYVSGGKIYGITVTNQGSGYTSTPTVSFSGGGGSGAAATAIRNTKKPKNILVNNLNVAAFRAFGDNSGTDGAAAIQFIGNSTTGMENCRVKNSIIPQTGLGNAGAISYKYITNDGSIFTEYNSLQTKGLYTHIYETSCSGVTAGIRDNALI